MAKSKNTVPVDISEEYYQISFEIYSSFPKYRPPVALFQFREDIASLYPFSKKGDRLSNEKIEQAIALCKDGSLFVSRTDLPIYSEHIVHQADLVLLDVNFKPSEVAEILIKALKMRYNDFQEQPVSIVYEKLKADLFVFTEYTSQDKYRLRPFLGKLYNDVFDAASHAVNTLILGAWIFTQMQDKQTRKTFNYFCLGLFLHDIGMCKLPAFLLTKKQGLTSEELQKIQAHPLVGMKMLHKLEPPSKEVMQAVYEHHERLDGSGYPQKNTQPSALAKITAIADSLSAMVQETPYRPKKPMKAAIEEISGMRTRYDTTFLSPIIQSLAQGTIKI